MGQPISRTQSFEELALPHLEDLYDTALYLFHDESQARYFVVESFARAYRSWPLFRIGSDCRTWLFRIMADAFHQGQRPFPYPLAAKGKVDECVGSIEKYRSPVHQLADRAFQVPLAEVSEEDLKRTIADLPDNCRLLVVLCLLQGFSLQQIADITSIDIKTVRRRMHQARKIMKEALFALWRAKASDERTQTAS